MKGPSLPPKRVKDKSSSLFNQLLFKDQSLAGRRKIPHANETKGSPKGGQIKGTGITSLPSLWA